MFGCSEFCFCLVWLTCVTRQLKLILISGKRETLIQMALFLFNKENQVVRIFILIFCESFFFVLLLRKLRACKT